MLGPTIPQVLVVDRTYDLHSTEGLCISLVSHHKLRLRLCSRNGQTTGAIARNTQDGKNRREVSYDESRITTGPAKIQFHRTLRVPDDAKNYLLPPGLGTFPFAPITPSRTDNSESVSREAKVASTRGVRS